MESFSTPSSKAAENIKSHERRTRFERGVLSAVAASIAIQSLEPAQAGEPHEQAPVGPAVIEAVQNKTYNSFQELADALQQPEVDVTTLKKLIYNLETSALQAGAQMTPEELTENLQLPAEFSSLPTELQPILQELYSDTALLMTAYTHQVETLDVDPTTPETFAVHNVSIDDLKAQYPQLDNITANGEQVVVTHGYNAGPMGMASFSVELLAQGYSVITLDIPAGASDTNEDQLNPLTTPSEAFKDATKVVLDDLTAKSTIPTNVVGYSFGANAARAAVEAVENGAPIQSVTLVNPAGINSNWTWDTIASVGASAEQTAELLANNPEYAERAKVLWKGEENAKDAISKNDYGARMAENASGAELIESLKKLLEHGVDVTIVVSTDDVYFAPEDIMQTLQKQDLGDVKVVIFNGTHNNIKFEGGQIAQTINVQNGNL